MNRNFYKLTKIYFTLLTTLVIVAIYGGSILVSKHVSVASLNSNSSQAVWREKQEEVRAALENLETVPDPKTINQKAKGVPVLLNHGILETEGDGITISEFVKQMYLLKKNGWNTLSIEEFDQFLKGKRNVPEKSFLLTFDDGRKDSYYYADPVLEALGYKATMFVITNSMGEGNFHLDESELKKMQRSGRWELHSHSKDAHRLIKIDAEGGEGHSLTNKKWLPSENRIESDEEFKNRIETDLIEAKKDIQELTGGQCNYFALPYGDYGQNSLNIQNAQELVLEVTRKTYTLSFYQEWSGNYLNYPDRAGYLAKRINIENDLTAEALLELLEAETEKILPFNDDFQTNQGWATPWGESSIDKNTMTLRTSHDTNGATILLDGSFKWEDYVFETDVILNEGETISLIARYQDDDNYYICDLSAGTATISAVKDGQRKVIWSATTTPLQPGREANIAIEVNKNEIDCYWNGKLIIYGRVGSGDLISNGGVGISVWGDELNQSSASIKKVQVYSP